MKIIIEEDKYSGGYYVHKVHNTGMIVIGRYALYISTPNKIYNSNIFPKSYNTIFKEIL